MARGNFILINQSILPYNLVLDYIRLKLTMRIGNRMSQKSGVTGVIYGNVAVDGGNTALATFSTNNYGVAEILIPTNSIPNKNINTCKLWAEGSYLGTPLNSVVARANFIYFPILDETFISAGICDGFITDRSHYNYNVYDGGDFCSGVYDRNDDLAASSAQILVRSASWL